MAGGSTIARVVTVAVNVLRKKTSSEMLLS